MARRTTAGDTAAIRARLIELITGFDEVLKSGDLREQVLALVPASHLFRDLGVSLLPAGVASSAKDRILAYFLEYQETVIDGDELAIVSGISEYARRVRELRKELGWPIYSGAAAKEMVADEPGDDGFGGALTKSVIEAMGTDDYVLVGEQDRDAAYRWKLANEIRRSDQSMRDRILKYLRANVGHPVTGEELRYVADDKQSWPRRTRELRTELGWPVVTRSSGRPDLSGGLYLLEADRQSPPHDRLIPDPVRVEVLERDGFACRYCGWRPEDRRDRDPRTFLELHHVDHHARGGDNEAANLLTLCNVHHDEVHRQDLTGWPEVKRWLPKD